jgi:hypothetical protein
VGDHRAQGFFHKAAAGIHFIYKVGDIFIGSMSPSIATDCYTITEVYNVDIIQYRLEPKQERYGVYTAPESYIDKNLKHIKRR